MNPPPAARSLAVVALGLLLGGCSGLSFSVDLRPRHPHPRPSAAPLVTGRLDLDAVTVVDGPASPIPPAEVDALEQQLGISVPDGYREYMARLGGGLLCTTLRVLTPAEILAQTPDHQGFMAAWWFWGPGDVPFGQDDAMASIPIADDMVGDAVAISPGDPDHLFVLPREGHRVLVRDADVLDLAGAMCRGELGGQPGTVVDFTPEESFGGLFTGMGEPIAPDLPPADLDRPPREVVDAYLTELTAVEAWAIEQAGGPDVVQRDAVPDELRRALDEQMERRLAGVHERYASPILAPVLRGVFSWAVPPLHSRFRVTAEETVDSDHARFLVVDADGQRIWWTFARGADGWRLVKQTFPDLVPG